MFHLRWVTERCYTGNNWKMLKCNTCVVVVSELQNGKTQSGMWLFVAFKFLQNSTFCLTACFQCATLNTWIWWGYSVGNTLMTGRRNVSLHWDKPGATCAGFRDDITSLMSVQIMSQSRSQCWKLPKKLKSCWPGAGSRLGLWCRSHSQLCRHKIGPTQLDSWRFLRDERGFYITTDNIIL